MPAVSATRNLGGWVDSKSGKAILSPPDHFKISWNMWKKILKQVAPNRAIVRGVANYCNAICNAIIFAVMTLATELKGKKATISAREIQNAVRLLYPNELAKHAVSEGTKAVCKVSATIGSVNKSSGLTIPPTKVKNAMKALRMASRHSASSSVYLAAVLEYTMAEIFELAHTKGGKVTGKYLTVYSLNAGVAGDDELKALGRRIYFNPEFTQLQKMSPRPEEMNVSRQQGLGLGPTRGPFAKAGFGRCCREVAQEFKDGLRFRAGAIQKLQFAAEAHLIRFVQKKMQPQPSAQQTMKKAASPFGAASVAMPNAGLSGAVGWAGRPAGPPGKGGGFGHNNRMGGGGFQPIPAGFPGATPGFTPLGQPAGFTPATTVGGFGNGNASGLRGPSSVQAGGPPGKGGFLQSQAQQGFGGGVPVKKAAAKKKATKTTPKK